MAFDILLDRTTAFTGLGDHEITTPAAGIYVAKVQLTCCEPSALHIEVRVNSVTRYVTDISSNTQNHIEFSFPYNCLANQSFIVSIQAPSGTINDKQLNTVKSTITIGQGA